MAKGITQSQWKTHLDLLGEVHNAPIQQAIKKCGKEGQEDVMRAFGVDAEVKGETWVEDGKPIQRQ